MATTGRPRGQEPRRRSTLARAGTPNALIWRRPHVLRRYLAPVRRGNPWRPHGHPRETAGCPAGVWLARQPGDRATAEVRPACPRPPLPCADWPRLGPGLVAGAVDGGAGDAEQVGQLGGAVLTCPVQGPQVGFLSWVELGLFAAQLPLGLGEPHALARAQADQVGLELGDHGQHVEQQPADRVVRVVHRAAEAQPDLAQGELLGDRPGVGQRAGQPVELGHHQGVALVAGGQRLPQPGTLPVGAGQAVIDVDASPGRPRARAVRRVGRSGPGPRTRPVCLPGH
ncbi:hypothetical protein SAMN06272737_118120 [Blastococcus mobilis]|uniref:Uncharacterized protein n=1 Tax=Blastococcus mobilis TaxID=1938746 RepID=A0A238Y9K1_9ACTN|nr:hypothetical protein SAMN06272737_118120 [Blastococcus mobilis]